MAKAENVRRTIPEKRNRKVKITTSKLQQIILEEYIKEETLEEELSPQQEEEMLAWIRKQGPKPDWLGDDYGHSKKVRSGQVPVDPNADRAAQTMPIDMDIPSDDAPESEYQGFQNDSESGIEDQLAGLIQGMDPESVADLFQTVFEKIPGIEMGTADAEEEPPPETLYVRGAEGRPAAGFNEELVNKIYGILMELDGLGSWGMKSMAGITGKRDEDEVDEGLDDYPDFEPAYDVMKGEGPSEKVPFHDFSDMEEPADTVETVAQKVWDAGIRFPEPLTDSADLKNEDMEKLFSIMDDAAGGMAMGKEFVSDVIEALWEKQSENENV